MVELNVRVKARKRSQDIMPKNILELMESDRPHVIMIDGTVYEGTCQDDERILGMQTSEPARFTDDVARAFAAGHKGVYFPSSRAGNTSIPLQSFIDGVRRLCKNLPQKAKEHIAKNPDFLKDLEGELKYLGTVSPIIESERLGRREVYGLVGSILDERAISGGRQESENFKLYGPQGRQYAITLGLCLNFFGERNFNVAGRFLSMTFPGETSDELKRLEELVNKRYVRAKEFECDRGSQATIQMSRHTLQMYADRPDETRCHLTMTSPAFSLLGADGIRMLQNYVPPLSTAQMLEKFVPVADLVVSAAGKLASQRLEQRMSETEGNVRKALGDAYGSLLGDH